MSKMITFEEAYTAFTNYQNVEKVRWKFRKIKVASENRRETRDGSCPFHFERGEPSTNQIYISSDPEIPDPVKKREKKDLKRRAEESTAGDPTDSSFHPSASEGAASTPATKIPKDSSCQPSTSGKEVLDSTAEKPQQLDNIFIELVELLHSEESKDLIGSLFTFHYKSKLDLSHLTDDERYKSFKFLALEAFQYAAESGSLKSIRWFCTYFPKQIPGVMEVDRQLQEIYHQFTALVDFGFTLYNLAFDLIPRYAYLQETVNLWKVLLAVYLESISRMKVLIDYYNLIDSDLGPSEISSPALHLKMLYNIIYVAFYTITGAKDITKEQTLAQNFAANHKANKLLYPPILMGLQMYNAALIENTIVGPKKSISRQILFLQSACKYLEGFADEESTRAVYFYNVLFELINVTAKSGTQLDLRFLFDMYKKLKGNRTRNDFGNQELRLKCLHQLALMRLALFLRLNQDLQMYCCDVPFYHTVESLRNSDGVPADWAFTVLSYFLAVHCKLITSETEVGLQKAFRLRNFLFKNFAYQLRGIKRICFMSRMFVGLQYDFTVEKPLHSIKRIAKYVAIKFEVEKYTNSNMENRHYISLVHLFLADVYSFHAGREKGEKFNKRIKNFTLLVPQSSKVANNLGAFLYLLKGTIQEKTDIVTIPVSKTKKKRFYESQMQKEMDESNCLLASVRLSNDTICKTMPASN